MPPVPRRSDRISEALLFAALLLVPLAASPRFSDQFTSVKWHLLAALAACWLLVERFACSSRGLPRVVVRTWPACASLGLLVIVGSLRRGPGWAMEPLLARATFATVALAAFWRFRRTGLGLASVRAAVLFAAAIVVSLGLVQLAGFEPMPWLTTTDHRSATFGNANMAAQFVGLSVVVLLARFPPPAAARRLAAEIVAGGGVAYVSLASSRSVALALAVALLTVGLLRRLTVGALLRVGAVALVSAGLVVLAAPHGIGPLDPTTRAGKQMSASLRLRVWSDSVGLVRDHPLGVGAGNFEPAFIPYALAGRSKPGETIVFRSPHNEYLRLLAEEGVVGASLLLALLARLVSGLRRSPAAGAWRSDPGVLLAAVGVFLAVEAFFQFPFELAYPSLLAAVLLGLAFAASEESPARQSLDGFRGEGRRRAGDVATGVAALAIGVGLARVVAAEYLATNGRQSVARLERACGLDPRRLEACVEAAWLHSRAGEHVAARRALDGVLRRSPDYFPAIKLLGEDLLAAGERAAGCRHLRRYDQMFGGRSSAHELVGTACATVSAGSPGP